MAYEKRPYNGTLFKNKDKDPDNEAHSKFPDYKGDGMLDEGQEVWLSAWIKEGAKGKFLSLSFKPKDKRQPTKQSAPPARRTPPRDADLDVDEEEPNPF